MTPTTMDQLPDEVADAIRGLVTEPDQYDREIPGLVVIEWLMLGHDAKTARRMLTWAWDRFVAQPERDALRMQTAAKAPGVEMHGKEQRG